MAGGSVNGDSHVVRPGNFMPICGSEPNDNVTLPLDRMRDPDTMDAVEICPRCVEQADRILGPVKRGTRR